MTDKKTVENKPTSSATSPKKPKKVIFTKPVVIIVILSLIIVLLGYAGSHFYIENKKEMADQKIKVSLLNQKLDDVLSVQNQNQQAANNLKEGLESHFNLMNSELEKVEIDNQANKTEVEALQRGLAATYIRQPNDWILYEVDYLVKLAGRKIWLEQDVKTAIALLIAADQRVVELNDHSLSALRAALLEDINILSSLPKRNPDTVILKLSSLERRISSLKTDGVVMPSANDNEKTAISHDVNDWQENLQKSWSTFLESFVVVNKRDARVEALLLPEQVWYLKANLRADLAKAEFAIYREQQKIYDIAMSDMSVLLKTYFVASDPATKHFKDSIKRLSKIKITISYPDQLKTTALLNRVMKLRVENALRPQPKTQQK